MALLMARAIPQLHWVLFFASFVSLVDVQFVHLSGPLRETTNNK